ncbi:DUF3284 domain-containing protein [Tannockella kyphosi]|uniref:DUF3284 domain-containing protein n=1 Tax=Tannockella kyphosi TaxID=2899121 RepID=UPI002010F5F7|nr:DUF3284 domain-containing protein [Tannockella kyphosi]
MEIKRTLAVSVSEFDDFIIEMIKTDVLNCTEKEPTTQEIVNGYQYRKSIPNKMGKPLGVTTELLEVVSGSYRASFTGGSGINYLSYIYEQSGECQIDLTYAEDFQTKSKFTMLNFKLMSFAFSRKTKRRINQVLINIENHIIEKRKTEEE